ncbi:hypothetical protein ACLMJK_000488 [Lecanora helva]
MGSGSEAIINGGVQARQLSPQWNVGMIFASIAISFLGAFTSTQLVLVWTLLSSLTFGFCSIWSLHFVAMLACELDLPIGINVPLTILSSFLAVLFTFGALATDLLWETWHRGKRRRSKSRDRVHIKKVSNGNTDPILWSHGSKPHFDYVEREGDKSEDEETAEHVGLLRDNSLETGLQLFSSTESGSDGTPEDTRENNPHRGTQQMTIRSPAPSVADTGRPPSCYSESRRSSSFKSTYSSHGLSNIMNLASRSTAPAKNAFVATAEALRLGCTRRNIVKAFSWSLAVSGMHYVGIAALQIPEGHYTLNPVLVVISGLISWIVCLVGVILLSQIETHLAQQFLFSVVASLGVAAMHFTGMAAATFWSQAQPSKSRGYPPALATAIVIIAISTCIAANFLLAHVATLSRNKLAEIVLTRKELWKTIALKENAEHAAAAKSDFIASASHEIRTPLHHLQGYSDLLSRTELTEEGRLLLHAIQHATKTLSLITNNVLDYSKLERHAEAACRPISLDMRTVAESILMLLPNRDDVEDVDLMVVVSPDVPHSLFLDETYIHRILMNLLSNALKFTRSGYILLLLEMKDDQQLVATVRDTGMGIPPSFLPQLFEPFTQAHSRGSQRGTGLGLSIIKQLLDKMHGTIDVESKHTDTATVDPEQTGSTFSVTIPVQQSSSPRLTRDEIDDRQPIAVFPGYNSRAAQGLRMAWDVFRFDVEVVQDFSDLAGCEWKYIWVDLHVLEQNQSLLRDLLRRDTCPVLVPYDSQEALKQVPEIASAAHFVTLQKPLIWHSFEERIEATKKTPNNILTKAVTFAPLVDILDRDDKEKLQAEPTAEPILILLVEDNPVRPSKSFLKKTLLTFAKQINQKLGKKMLTALGYQVMTADDGQDAIEQILKLDATVDAILMDQSMPRKDGVTATKEIRTLEAQGKLTRRKAIIALTAVVNAESQALFKAAGADDFLTKPLSLDQLKQTLVTHLPSR